MLQNLLFEREIYGPSVRNRRDLLASARVVDRLAHCETLRGHTGCVNCLYWNGPGTLLASGSDDRQVRIWDVSGRALHSFSSGHHNNVFSVVFLPDGQDSVIVSAAADCYVRMHDYPNSKSPFVWQCNGRVKRLAVNANEPTLFWSASEDGIINEYDARGPDVRQLITFDDGSCKTLAVNTVRPQLLAVGLNRPTVPLYDRRFLNPQQPLPALEFTPAHIPMTRRIRLRPLTVTHIGFNSCGNEMIVNIGGEQIYIFNILDRVGEPEALETLTEMLLEPVPETDIAASSSAGEVATKIGGRSESAHLCRLNSAESSQRRDAGDVKSQDELISSVVQMLHSEHYSSAVDECSNAIVDLEKKGKYWLENGGAAALCRLLYYRSVSYFKRKWDGDVYAAVLDIVRLLKMEPTNERGCRILVKLLVDLRQFRIARMAFNYFRAHFPLDHSALVMERLLEKEGSGAGNGMQFEHSPDFVQRFCGHANVHTDIKEAVFFGDRDEYVVAGSDCGSLLVWNRATGALVKGFKADDAILNCVQPHPSSLLLATSGIEDVIRFWRPVSDEQRKEMDTRERNDLVDLAIENQRTQRAIFFEMIVTLNVGLPTAADDEAGQMERDDGMDEENDEADVEQMESEEGERDNEAVELGEGDDEQHESELSGTRGRRARQQSDEDSSSSRRHSFDCTPS